MQSFVPSSSLKKQLQKTISAKKLLKLNTMLKKLRLVPNTLHARRETILDNYQAKTKNQAYSTFYYSRVESVNDKMYSSRVESVKDKMYADLTEKRVLKVVSVDLSVNDNNSTNIVDDPMRESKHGSLDDRVDDSIFEDFIRRNRERFVRDEKEETASVMTGQQRSSGHYVMDDWIFEDFIRRNRNRFQHEKEEIISIDDYSDDELDDSVAY